MALLDAKDTETTTLLQIIQDAEASEVDQFDLVHLSLDSGRDLILLAVVGDDLGPVGAILDALRLLQVPQT